MSENEPRGRVVVMSGPSGAGKTSVCRELKKHPRIEFSISATTRRKRDGEVDGVDYYFLTEDDFRERVERGEFVEHAVYSGNHYGTLRAPMQAAIEAGRIYVLEIEVQGTEQLRRAGLEATYIFVAPPSIEELRRRLRARATDASDEIERRIAIAENEMSIVLAQQESADERLYDHVVENDDLDVAIARVRELIGL